jgi:CheY-like chemotaxis protein
MAAERPRILIVDDEEAILETMTFTFEDDYEVLTSSSPRAALELLDTQGPVAVVVSDQRMPEMTGVEFLARVFQKHPQTTRIILTGFADMDAIIRAINDGHVYAYITKPWEPEQLKQVVRRAVDHYRLAVENERLVSHLRDANLFLEAVMDQLDTGALAVDAGGVVRAANRPAREYLGMTRDPRGRRLEEVLGPAVQGPLANAMGCIQSDAGTVDVDLPVRGGVKLRIGMHKLASADGRELGQVIFAREVSHEPLRRRFDELVENVAATNGELRTPLAAAQSDLAGLAQEVRGSSVASPGMAELADRISRTLTAIEYWLAVDDSLASSDFPDAQLLRERMRLANARWALPDRLPVRVGELARRVEVYYETGENPKTAVL